MPLIALVCAPCSQIRGDRGLGFTVVGGVDTGSIVRVKRVIPNGVAAQDGCLMERDVILKVNGQNVESMSHNEVISALKESGPQVTLEIDTSHRFRYMKMHNTP